ncbi:MlaD family protein [Candidatus Margulisiibacteriota bacterium]
MKTATKVGFVTFLGIVLLATLLFWKSGIITHVKGFTIVGSFQSTNGLLDGAEVRYRGFRIGTVSKIKPRAKDILVYVRVSKKINIPDESILRVEFDGLIGEKFIGIIPGPDPLKLYESGTVLKGTSSAGIVDFVDIGTQNLDETKKILVMLYQMLEDGQVQKSVRNILSNVEITTSELNELIPSLQDIAINLNLLTQSITPIMGDPSVHRDFRETVDNIKKVSNEVNILIERINDETIDDVNALLTSAKEASDGINDILADGDLRTDIKGTLKSSKKLMDRINSFGLTDIRALAGVDYYTVPKKWGYRAGLSLGVEENNWLLQLKSLDQTVITDIQKRNYFSDNLGFHLGMVNMKPGLGLDVRLADFMSLSTSLYDIDQMEAELSTVIRLNDNLKMIGEASDMLRENQTYSVGVQVNN